MFQIEPDIYLPKFRPRDRETALLHKSGTPQMPTGIAKSRIKNEDSLVFDWLYQKNVLTNKRSI